jgi:transcriptional regulator with XRE-family HTH domain
MTKTIDGGELVSKLLADPEVKAEYDRMKPVMELAWTLVEARNRAKMTQAEVARKMGTTQSVIARIEGGRSSPTVETVRRFFQATGCEFRIQLLPAAKSKRKVSTENHMAA